MKPNIFAVSLLIPILCVPGNSNAQELSVTEIMRILAPGVQSAYEELRRSIDLEVQFETNSAKLTKRAEKQLAILGTALISERLAKSKYIIAGHTDASGPAVHNKLLSLKRAKAVVTYLKQKFQINPARFVVKGHGEEQLKDPGDPRASTNRRVQIILLDEKETPGDYEKDALDLGLGKPFSKHGSTN